MDQRKALSGVDNPAEKLDEEAHLHNKLESPIFRLNVGCLNKIFDYLSFCDLRSIGETCKPMQQVAGKFFQANHVTVAYVKYKDMYTLYYSATNNNRQIDGFYKFQQNLCFETMPSSRSLKKVTWYVGKNYTQESKGMQFQDADLTGAEIRNLSDKFEKVESVWIERCVVNRKFYERFPKLSKNLRRLHIEDFDCRRNVMRRIGNEWLLWTYPKLEHLHWTQSKDWRQINELQVFFERNPQVRSFTTDIDSLWNNKHLFSESGISLDDLTIEMGRYRRQDNLKLDPVNIEHIYACLKELYEKGVYKRLHINLKCFNQGTFDEMPPLNALKSMCLDYNNCDPLLQPDRYNIILPNWIDLTELNLLSCCYSLDMDTLARQLVNLQRLYIRVIHRPLWHSNNLMPFVRRSVYLTKMKMEVEFLHCAKYIDFAELNEERKKLKGARRMTIYIQEEIYLRSKWEMIGMEYSLIDIRRFSSDEWCHQYGSQN